jgi:hypothetical protein
MRFVGLAIVLFCVGCCGSGPLRVRHVYLDPRHLASSHVQTPDPRQCSFYGQQLIINWKLPKDYLCSDDLWLLLTVRYGTHEEGEVCVPIRQRCGQYVYRLMGKKYSEVCGIVTYKVEVVGGGKVLESWHHQVWTELIEFEDV